MGVPNWTVGVKSYLYESPGQWSQGKQGPSGKELLHFWKHPYLPQESGESLNSVPKFRRQIRVFGSIWLDVWRNQQHKFHTSSQLNCCWDCTWLILVSNQMVLVTIIFQDLRGGEDCQVGFNSFILVQYPPKSKLWNPSWFVNLFENKFHSLVASRSWHCVCGFDSISYCFCYLIWIRCFISKKCVNCWILAKFLFKLFKLSMEEISEGSQGFYLKISNSIFIFKTISTLNSQSSLCSLV